MADSAIKYYFTKIFFSFLRVYIYYLDVFGVYCIHRAGIYEAILGPLIKIIN